MVGSIAPWRGASWRNYGGQLKADPIDFHDGGTLIGGKAGSPSVRKLLQLYLLQAERAGPEWLLVSALRESPNSKSSFLRLKRHFRIHPQTFLLPCRNSWPTFTPGRISVFCLLTRPMTPRSPSGMQKQTPIGTSGQVLRTSQRSPHG